METTAEKARRARTLTAPVMNKGVFVSFVDAAL